MPGFAAWLSRERRADTSDVLGEAEKAKLATLDVADWADNEEAAAVQPVMVAAAAWYFLRARDAKGRIVDPVARFHLGNGARLERLDFLADRSRAPCVRRMG